MSKFYITTAIDYVNSIPHIGTAYEKIGADALARFMRMDGHEVHFQMGNDEHSVNVQKAAIQQGLSPKAYCDQMREKFLAIWQQMGISCDDFIQTSEPRHHQGVTKLFQVIYDKGDIYQAPYEGWYCESCEAFFTEKDLVDGVCPNHKSKPKWLKEDNYFFKLSAYQQKLLNHYQQHPEFILPEIRRNEVVRLVESGLQDISVSRSSFDWGIPLPIDKKHVVYVWFDALVNYLSAIGYGDDVGANLVFAPGRSQGSPLQKWWPADMHIIGKDITRFHCVIWPAMLMSAGLPLPKTVFGHGFVFLKGEKMSKSLGNIVTPLDVIPQYGADALRYYLLRESSFGSDGDFTWDNFIKRYNSDLANDLGNVLNRTLGMVNKYLGGTLDVGAALRGRPGSLGSHIGLPLQDRETELKGLVESTLDRVRVALDPVQSGDINFHAALAEIWKVIAATDKYIDSSAPWKLFKEGNRAAIEAVLYHAADTIRNIALLVRPFLPTTSERIWQQLDLENKLPIAAQTFKNIAWGETPAPLIVKIGEPMFPRIETEGVMNHAPTKKGNQMETTELIDIGDFAKVQLRVAEVVAAEKVEGADKLLKLQVAIGEERRQIVAGIAQHYTPEQIVGKSIIIVANLKPAKIRGVESNGMLLAASHETGLSIVTLDRPLASGARVK